jgi:hypothetical protein
MIELIWSHRKACSCLHSLLTFQLAADTPTQASLGHDALTADPTVGDLGSPTANSVQLGTTRLRRFNSGITKIKEESESKAHHSASDVENDSNEGRIQSPGT